MSVYHRVTLCKEDNVSTRKLMNTQQAAEYVGQYYGREPNSPRTIVSWIHSGLLKASREPGARGRFVIDEVDLLRTLGASEDQIERVHDLQKVRAYLNPEDMALLERGIPIVKELPADVPAS